MKSFETIIWLKQKEGVYRREFEPTIYLVEQKVLYRQKSNQYHG